MTAAEPAVHPDLASLAFLLGTWRGPGRGEYPTIESFDYTEEIRFEQRGKPFLAYAQRTWGTDGLPRHSESGYWRPVPPDGVELVLAHHTGIVSVEEGRVQGATIELASRAIAGTSTAKDVARLERSFVLDGDVLRYDLRMAAVGVGLTHHLSAELRRIDG